MAPPTTAVHPFHLLSKPRKISIEEERSTTSSSLGVRQRACIWNVGMHDGEMIHSAAIITCEPNSILEPIHNHTPVLISEADWPKWLTARMGEFYGTTSNGRVL